MDRLYTAEASVRAANGAVITSDDRLDLQLPPKCMGGDDGPGTNPEQLFAAGYAACFHSAMRHGLKDVGLSLNDLEGSHVTARVHFLKGAPAEFGLAVDLELTAPLIEPEKAREPDGAHPPDLPVLEGDRRQHRRPANRRQASAFG